MDYKRPTKAAPTFRSRECLSHRVQCIIFWYLINASQECSPHSPFYVRRVAQFTLIPSRLFRGSKSSHPFLTWNMLCSIQRHQKDSRAWSPLFGLLLQCCKTLLLLLPLYIWRQFQSMLKKYSYKIFILSLYMSMCLHMNVTYVSAYGFLGAGTNKRWRATWCGHGNWSLARATTAITGWAISLTTVPTFLTWKHMLLRETYGANQ